MKKILTFLEQDTQLTIFHAFPILTTRKKKNQKQKVTNFF